MSRLVIVEYKCPYCRQLLRAVSLFNSTAPPDKEIEIVFQKPYKKWLHRLVKNAYSDMPEKKFDLPLLVFDGFIFRREEIKDGIEHPLELESTLRNIAKEEYWRRNQNI